MCPAILHANIFYALRTPLKKKKKSKPSYFLLPSIFIHINGKEESKTIQKKISIDTTNHQPFVKRVFFHTATIYSFPALPDQVGLALLEGRRPLLTVSCFKIQQPGRDYSAFLF